MRAKREQGAILRSVAVAVSAGLALCACASLSPKLEAADDIHAFLVAVRNGDRAGFDARVDRPALKVQLRSRVIALQAQQHGEASWQALGAVLAGPLVDVAVDAYVRPEVFRAEAIRLGYDPSSPAPSRLAISTVLRQVDREYVCVVTSADGPCLFTFRDEGGVWRLTGYEGPLIPPPRRGG